MIIYFSIFSALYTLLIIAFIRSWDRTAYFTVDPLISQDTFITIIIPVRDEEDNILKLLNDIHDQTYPKQNFEVLIIDDGSTDKTIEQIQNFKADFSCSIIFLKSDPKIKSHKKRAIETGVKQAKGELIVCTDGDCRVNKGWLSSIQNFYKFSDAKMIVGLVSFYDEQTLFEKMQTLEFASLIGSGAASLNLGFPNMCNGANLAYQKSVFFEVNGYAGNDNLPSGDDEFLMHKIFNAYPKKVKFLKSYESVVLTHAKENVKAFFNQRKRWASKWDRYEMLNIKYLAFFIFAINLNIILSLVLGIAGIIPIKFFLVQIGIKLTLDYLFLNRIMAFFNKKISFLIFILTGILYPFYVSFFALISKMGEYEWKNRKVKVSD